jgi:hypothetical protein
MASGAFIVEHHLYSFSLGTSIQSKAVLDSPITFTLKGKTFERRKQDFAKAMQGVAPPRIQK